jgi:hypothetical protein
VQDSVKVLEVLRGAVVSKPEVALAPVHAPEAVHEVAKAVDQLSVVVPLPLIGLGVADSEIVGTGSPFPDAQR